MISKGVGAVQRQITGKVAKGMMPKSSVGLDHSNPSSADLKGYSVKASPEEQAFLDKKQGFFGTIIPKQYGGKGFSAHGHSQVVQKISTRSGPAAGTATGPGPGELLMRYGTEAQKSYFLPRLASGDLIPCFGLTAHSGSDATSMSEAFGEVVERNGQLGIVASLNKHCITLAPVAGVVGLAFNLKGTGHEGITIALLERDRPGLQMGRRPDPLVASFMNGGKDVFIPMKRIIGGQTRCGFGCSTSLPASAIGAAKASLNGVGAYARVPRSEPGSQRRLFSTFDGGKGVDAFSGLTPQDVADKLRAVHASKHLLDYVLRHNVDGNYLRGLAKSDKDTFTVLEGGVEDWTRLLGLVHGLRAETRIMASGGGKVIKLDKTTCRVDEERFVDQADFAVWLQESNLAALLDADGRTVRSLSLLREGVVYTGQVSTVNMKAQVQALKDAELSKVSFKLAAELGNLPPGPVLFKGHDLMMKDENNEDAGDVDTLFVSRDCRTHYLVERKSSIREVVMEQIDNTISAYRKYVLTAEENSTVDIQPVLYVPGAPEEILDSLCKMGIHILTDAMLFRPARH